MKTFTIALFACLLISCPIVVHGGTAHLVADLMSGATSDSNPASFTRFGDKLLFIATNGAEGRELWITDGTLAGTHLVKDIAPGIRSAFPLAYNSTSIPAAIGVSGSLAHFWANDSPIQLQGGLWRTDGTAAGTVFLAPLTPGTSDFGSRAGEIAGFDDGRAIITWSSDKSLWVSDGTAAGTKRLLKDTDPRLFPPVFHNVGHLGRYVYFTYDTSGPRQLWKTDGTAAGTTLVQSNWPGGQMFEFRGALYSMQGQLWTTDGTAAGSVMIRDFGVVTTERLVGSSILVLAEQTTGVELWKSDGTGLGTQLVTTIPSPRQITAVATAGDILYFEMSNHVDPPELWRSDGTAAGTIKVLNTAHTGSYLFPGVGRRLFVMDVVLGGGFYRTDGTPDTTVRISDSDHLVAMDPSGNAGMGTLGSAIFFAKADPTHGVELWTSDGSSSWMFANLNEDGSSSPTLLTPLGDGFVFRASDDSHGSELWFSDGTTAGTRLLRDIRPGSAGSAPFHLMNIGSKLLFVADDGTTGRELWATDGTPGGTQLVKDIYPGTAPAFFNGNLDSAVVNGVAYFPANDGVHGVELWRSDGTAAGTQMVVDLVPGSSGSMGTGPVVAYKGNIYFATNQGLARTDGTASGTSIISTAVFYGYLTAAAGRLFFVAYDAQHGYEPWISDGTSGGTHVLKSIRPGTGSYNASADQFFEDIGGGIVLFIADDGVHGTELWRTDGTPEGTAMVADINPGSSSGVFNFLSVTPNHVVIGSNLFFVANDGVHGNELWKSDGTAAGTVMVKDIWPGSVSSDPLELRSLFGRLYFQATDGANGRELWTSDGTAAGTFMVCDVAPGRDSSGPSGMIAVGDRIYFAATTSETGNELWSVDRVLDNPAGLRRRAVHP